jgi:hypothetical protein
MLTYVGTITYQQALVQLASIPHLFFFFTHATVAYQQALVQLASIPHLSAREAEEVLKAALLARGTTAAPPLKVAAKP